MTATTDGLAESDGSVPADVVGNRSVAARDFIIEECLRHAKTTRVVHADKQISLGDSEIGPPFMWCVM